LARVPAGIVADYDGTLARIVDDPSRAWPVPEAVGALRILGARLAVVAFVTGRAARDVRVLSGLDGVLVVGNHGTEWLLPGAAEPEAPTLERAAVRVALETALDRVPRLSGVVVEDKGLSATVHVRAAHDPAAARSAVAAALGDLGPGLELREGRMSLELRPVGAGDKGTALEEIVARFALRGVLVMGDDVTDLDMFRAAAALRAAGRIEAAILAVGGHGEVPGAVGAAADATLADPLEAARLLATLAADEGRRG
jgi:trehalose 6-phosphate phosphatase